MANITYKCPRCAYTSSLKDDPMYAFDVRGPHLATYLRKCIEHNTPTDLVFDTTLSITSPCCGKPVLLAYFFTSAKDYHVIRQRYEHQYNLRWNNISTNSQQAIAADIMNKHLKGESDDFVIRDEAYENLKAYKRKDKGTDSIEYWQKILEKRGLM